MNNYNAVKLSSLFIGFLVLLCPSSRSDSVEEERQEIINFTPLPSVLSSKQVIINHLQLGNLKIVDIDESFFLVIYIRGSVYKHWEFLLYNKDKNVWRLSGAAFSFEELSVKIHENEIELINKDGRTYAKFAKIGKTFVGHESREQALERQERWRREMNHSIRE